MLNGDPYSVKAANPPTNSVGITGQGSSGTIGEVGEGLLWCALQRWCAGSQVSETSPYPTEMYSTNLCVPGSS